MSATIISVNTCLVLVAGDVMVEVPGVRLGPGAVRRLPASLPAAVQTQFPGETEVAETATEETTTVESGDLPELPQ